MRLVRATERETTMVTSSLELPTVLQRIVDLACELLQLPHSALLLRQGEELVFTATERDIPREWQEALGNRLKIGDGVVGWVAAHRTPLVVPDLLTDAWVKRPDMARKYGFRAALAVPVQMQEELIGVLLAFDGRVRAFTADEVRVLAAFGQQAALAIHHARLYEEARQLAAQLAESEAKYRGLLESASDAIVINQGRRYVYFNRAWVELLGYAPEEIPTKDFLEFYAPAWRATINERQERRLRGELVPTRYEVQLQKKDGTLIDVEHSISRIVYQGQPAAQVIVRDISERRRAEAELRMLGQALKSIGEGVAITDMQGHVLFVNREAVWRGLQIIEQAALDGAEVVRRIQHFTRFQPGKTFAVVDVGAIVQDAVEMTKPRWKEELQARGIAVELTTRPTPDCLVEGDATELREVLVNLILNALDAMPRGGTLRITTEATARQVILTVADTGIGMPPAVQRQVFEPFFTTKGPQSSGLGLSLAYGIVHRHGGTITVDSQVSRGTTFTITLPRAVGSGTASEVPGAVATDVGRGRMLVIDDEPQVAQMLADILTAWGHDVDVALSGETGLERLAQGSYDRTGKGGGRSRGAAAKGRTDARQAAAGDGVSCLSPREMGD